MERAMNKMPDWMAQLVGCTVVLGMFVVIYSAVKFSIEAFGLVGYLDHFLHIISTSMFGERRCYEFGCMRLGENRRDTFYIFMTLMLSCAIAWVMLRYMKEQYPFHAGGEIKVVQDNYSAGDDRLLKLQARKKNLENSLNEINQQIINLDNKNKV